MKADGGNSLGSGEQAAGLRSDSKTRSMTLQMLGPVCTPAVLSLMTLTYSDSLPPSLVPFSFPPYLPSLLFLPSLPFSVSPFLPPSLTPSIHPSLVPFFLPHSLPSSQPPSFPSSLPTSLSPFPPSFPPSVSQSLCPSLYPSPLSLSLAASLRPLELARGAWCVVYLLYYYCLLGTARLNHACCNDDVSEHVHRRRTCASVHLALSLAAARGACTAGSEQCLLCLHNAYFLANLHA